MLLGIPRPVEDALAEEAHRKTDKRQAQKRPEGEHRIDGEHEEQAPRDDHGRIDDHQGSLAQKLPHGLHVIGETGHEVARLVVLEIGKRQFQDMRKDDTPKVPLHAPGKAKNVHAPEVAEHALQGGRGQNQQRVGDQQPRRPAWLEHPVDAPLDEPGDGHAHQIGGHEGDNANDQQAPVTDNQEFNLGIIAKNGFASTFLFYP
jgi:hypothetical protein